MSEERTRLGLPIGANVGRYRVRQVHAEWGFYLTYLAEETGTNRLVLLHELLPEELVQRAADGTVSGRTERTQESLAWARERFLAEGRALAACPHPAIQKFLDVFEAHGTAYWVTPAEEGRSFKQWLQDLGHLPAEAELRPVLEALLPALAKVHAAGLQHLNLKPETIRMAANGQPLLVHFAGSRQAIAQHSHAASAVTTGYSPIEQYEPDKAEGPWTDIYSLGAVLHRAVTGKAPPEATLRTPGDPYQKLAGRLPGAYSGQFLSAIDAALAVDATARPQSIEGWGKMLGASGEKKAPPPVRRRPWGVIAGAAAAVVLLGVVLWRVLHPAPVPVPPKDDPAQKEKDRQAEIAKEKEKAEEEKKKAEEQKKMAEEKKKAEEARTAELQKKIEEQKKAEAEKQAAETAAQEKAAIEKQAEEAAAKRAEEAKEAEKSAEAEKAAAEQAAKKVEEAKVAAKKKAAEKEAAAAADKAQEAQDKADKAALEQAAADVIAKKAGVERATAEKTAAERTVAQKSLEEQIAKGATEQKAPAEKAAAEQAAQKAGEEKAAAEQAVEQKAAEEKAAAERLAAAIAAQKEREAKAKPHEKSEAEKAAEEIAAQKPAEEKAEAEKAAMEKAAAEMAGKKAAEEKAAAEKAAADKAAAEMAGKKAAEERAAAEKAAADKAAAEKEAEEKAKEKAAQNSGGPPPPSGSGGGEVGSGLGGVWETTLKNANGQPLRKLIIYPDSRYELSGDVTDTGFISAKLGIIGMNSRRAIGALTSTFKYKTMGLIETDGDLGKFDWVRTSPDAPRQNKEDNK